MRIGVTGAFGYLGANFVAELLATGTQDGDCVAYAARTRANPLFDPSRVRVEALDVLDAGALRKAFAGLDALVHFAGKVGYLAAERRAVWDANVLGAARVFEACREAKVGKVLYISSISALGEATEGLADESSSPYGNPRYPLSFRGREEALAAVDASLRGDYGFLDRVRVAYLDSKTASRELAARYAEAGLPVVTVYPGTAVGPGDLHYALSSLVDSVWEGRLGLTTGGATSFVDARDFARGARLALEAGAPGASYVVSGADSHNLSYRDFQVLVSRVAREHGGRGAGRPLALPARLAVAAGAAMEALSPRMGLSRALALSGEVRNVCSSAKAMRDLGYAPRADLASSILDCRRFSEAVRSGRRPS